LVATIGCWPIRPTWVKNTGSEFRQFSSISVGRCMPAAEYASTVRPANSKDSPYYPSKPPA